jgi:hypothetical protein
MADKTLAGMETGGDSPGDRLFAGPADHIRAEEITLLAGQKLSRGALLGRIGTGGVTVTGAGAGKGVLTPDATAPVKANAKPGAYTATCIAAAQNGGTFRVEDPDGFVLGDIAVGATFDDDIKFAIADGDSDFEVGDTITVTVAAGSGKYVLSLAAAADGSQVPDAILAHDCDATSADKDTVAYKGGWFNAGRVTYGTGHTAASVREALRDKGIMLINTIPA